MDKILLKIDKNILLQLILKVFIFLVIFLYPLKTSAIAVGDETNFNYTGSMQSFTTEVPGYYRLEAWGGQGYTYGSYTGGYGAYSTGVVKLDRNETIYIAVGAQGGGGRGSSYTAWPNGGTGRANDSVSFAGAGGGSTNFTTVNKSLVNITASNLSQILLVAAGGGSATYGNGNAWSGVGGNGGGIVGNSGRNVKGTFACGGGGSQTSGGSAGYSAQRGAFGVGGSTAAAGGGGFYGGGSSWGSAGGGGSSYIGNLRLLTYKDVTKSMYCYSCTSSTALDTYTVNTANVSTSAISTYAKQGNGAAKVTLLQILSDEARLSNITLSKGELDKEFSPDIYEYNVYLDSEDYKLDINATPMDDLAQVIGEGSYIIKTGTTDYNLVVTAENGKTLTYVLHIKRAASSYEFLDDIKINGKSLENFNPITMTYSYELDYDQDEVDIEAILGRPSQKVDGIGKIKVSSGTSSKNIVVLSEDQSKTAVYTINFTRAHSSKLKSLTIDDYFVEPAFSKDVYEYTVNIMSSTLSLDIKALPFDEEATVSLKGFGYIKSTTTATITVKEPNSEDTVYTIRIVKEDVDEVATYDYPYSGKIEEFVANTPAYYKIEAWGAQGYTVHGIQGGFGAYSTGVVKLYKNDRIYINVGQGGRGGLTPGYTSYPNGGTGGAGDRVSYAGSGGGSTNITTVDLYKKLPTYMLKFVKYFTQQDI